MKKIGNADKLMAQIANLMEAKIKDDEFTLAEFMSKHDVTIASARTLLAKLVSNGVLKKRKITHEGRLTNVYSENKKQYS